MAFATSIPAFLLSTLLPLRRTNLHSPLCRRRFASAISAASTTTASAKPRENPVPATDPNEGPTLVIVESPAKAATIQSILPSSLYRVRSCVGHIREIPSSAKRIPQRYKSLPWARLGVDVDDDFRPIYVLISGKQAVLTELRAELRQASRLVLATDDDREGEAISWHLLEVLKPSVPVRRAVFHEITPEAITAAFNSFRDLNMSLVNAQETRRVLDRLAGYTMSPLLWKKIARGLSAGRVQSVAMSVIVRRETERLLFVPVQYAGCSAVFVTPNGHLKATLSSLNGRRLVKGSDFHQRTGQLQQELDPSSVTWLDHDSANAIATQIRQSSASVKSVDCRRTTRHPPPPLITSTLQQECGNRLGMGAGKTMSVAQKLYETGLITYMRTDNPVISDPAVEACRETIERLFGADALWNGEGGPRGAKPKAAQAAHEAIRPAGTQFLTPDELSGVSDEERSVYAIIFRRALASQMASAKLDQTTVKVELPLAPVDASERQMAEFKATGSVIVKPGFLELFKDDKSGASNDSSFLPPVSSGEELLVSEALVLDHETKPPPRFNDASLVKELEERGVGRPSTYAGIIEKLITRGYVYRGRMLPDEKRVPPKALVPSLTAFAVEKLLSTHFASFVDAEFTARMEHVLDEIASGSTDRVKYLQQYYSGEDGLAASVQRTEDTIDATSSRRVVLPNMPEEMLSGIDAEDKERRKTKTSTRRKTKSATRDADEPLSLDWGKMRVLVSSYGPYIEMDGVVVASLPKTTLADDLSAERLSRVLELAQDPVLGLDESSGLDVLLRTSRFGPYVQLGRDADAAEGTKPKRCGLLPGMDVGDLTVEIALKLLSLPRLLGVHPRSGEEVRAAMGPYGPYVVHGDTFVSLKKDVHNVLEIELLEAMELIDAAELRKQMRLEKQAKKKAEKEALLKAEVSKDKKKGDVNADADANANEDVKKGKKTRRRAVKTEAVSSVTEVDDEVALKKGSKSTKGAKGTRKSSSSKSKERSRSVV